MARPQAFRDTHYLKALPTNESDAITITEVIERVGCKRATAQKWLAANVENGMISLGPPGYMGAHTYYRTSARPDNWLPRITDTRGVMLPINTWIEGLLKKETSELADKPLRKVYESILKVWIGANSDDVKFTEINQAERIKLLAFKADLKKWTVTVDSMLNDPYLSGEAEDVTMAQDAMRGVSADISLELVIDKYNDLTAL